MYLNSTAHQFLWCAVDLNGVAVEDRHAPSRALREAVEYMYPTELFPFSTRSSKGLQLDHTQAYGFGSTGVHNLTPLSVKAHRAKTAGHWRTRTVAPGRVWWQSPLRFQYLRSASGTTRLDDHHPYSEVCAPAGVGSAGD